MKVKVIRIPSRYERVIIENDKDLDHAYNFFNDRFPNVSIETDDISRYISINNKNNHTIIRDGSIVHLCGLNIISIESILDSNYTEVFNKLSNIKSSTSGF